jgi:hypothetical protein
MSKLDKVFRHIEHAVVAILLVVMLAFLLSFLLPAGAMLSAETGEDNSISANQTAEATSLAGKLSALLPDISKIYRKAVNYPLQKAEEDITDPDIREFYQGYLKEIGLGQDH